jgi:hypothetical protein
MKIKDVKSGTTVELLDEYERTPWFSCDTPPVRHGWYEVRYYLSSNIYKKYFGGNGWMQATKEDEFFQKTNFGIKSDEWRGITEKSFIQATASE